MLSRTADNLYWLARYVERAECLARRFGFRRQDILHPHVDRGGDLTAGMGVHLFLKPHLQARYAVIVGIGDAQQLRCSAAIGPSRSSVATIPLGARTAAFGHKSG